MIITPATSLDIPALCELLNELFTQEAEFKPDFIAQSQGLAAIINHPEVGCILVARDQQQVFGMVNLLYTVSTALGGRVAILEDMVIASAYRHQGSGTELLGYAIEFARQNACKRITLLTDHHNVQAQKFYAKHGFKLSTMAPLRLDLTEN